MQDEIDRSRSPFQKKNSGICVLIVVVLFVFMYVTGICTFESLPDNSFLFLMAFSAVNVLVLAVIFSSVMILWEEAVETKVPIPFSRIVNCLNYKIFISSFAVMAIFYFCSRMDNGLYTGLQIMFLNILFAILLPCTFNLFKVFDYDTADISFSQNSNKSIGAVWAIGAYMSYYELILPDMIRKIEDFETENDIQIPVKKLIIICPLSCNVRGSLKDCDRMFYKGHLEVLEVDQGGNVNRKYKNCVYGIKRSQEEVTHVVAEYASPLGTLWEQRLSMNKDKWKYHRDCLIQNLKDFLQNLPCIVLEYDDKNPLHAEPLSNALLSAVNQHVYK